MVRNIKTLYRRVTLLVNRGTFHLFFKRLPANGDYCNSKRISVLISTATNINPRHYLAFIRCGAKHQLIDDGGQRNFDIALNLYAPYTDKERKGYEYLIVGGLNKYKAAYQFIDDNLLLTYKGFIFLDDDLEITYSDLNSFLSYCTDNDLQLAQPSLTRDSYCSHGHLINMSPAGCRSVDMVEVMCPYFSAEALRSAMCTFDLSYSTWGLDYIWPKLLKVTPVVVDEFTVRHTRPRSSSGKFYKYMKAIGVSPDEELKKLKNISLEKL